MIYALVILVTTTLLCAALGFVPKWAGLARAPAMLGTGAALLVSLAREGLPVGSALVVWPPGLAWLGQPTYRSDALSAGLGAWALLLGLLCLLKIGAGRTLPWQIATAMLAIGTLYSLVHTWNLLAFAAQVLFLALLVWAYCSLEPQGADRAGGAGRYRFALGLGALLLLGAALIIGRATGGNYDLATLSLSALSVWPLALIIGFTILWLGVAPFTGWSSQGEPGAFGALVQAVLIGTPVVTLLLRLEALLTAQGLAGTVPPGWAGFTTTLVWAGAATALVSGAGMLLWAGTARWTSLLTVQAAGLSLWALGLDSPSGRYAALAIVLAYGAGRVTLELASIGSGAWSRLSRAVAVFSLAAAPATPGFVGLWLLGAALGETTHASLVIALAGIAILAACGVALEFGPSILSPREQDSRYVTWVGIALAATLLAGGAMPALWLPGVSTIAGIAGGTPATTLAWTGLEASAGLSAPITLLAAGALLLGAIGGLVVVFARSDVSAAGVLLPTAWERINKAGGGNSQSAAGQDMAPLRSNVPAFVWWLSLAWLESGVWGLGLTTGRLAGRAGGLLARLEGRFYFPLAIILALIFLLIITR